MQKSKTHFEQIPVETVKKIAQDLPPNNAVERDSVNDGTEPEDTTTQEDWRQLAQRVQQEPDPAKVWEFHRLLREVKPLVERFLQTASSARVHPDFIQQTKLLITIAG